MHRQLHSGLYDMNSFEQTTVYISNLSIKTLHVYGYDILSIFTLTVNYFQRCIDLTKTPDVDLDTIYGEYLNNLETKDIVKGCKGVYIMDGITIHPSNYV